MITKLASSTVYLNNQFEATVEPVPDAACDKKSDDASSDDATLLRLLAINQSDALSTLYDRYGRLVYSIAYNSVGDQAIAEEIVQDVFTRVWEKANTYNAGRAKVSTWLASITRNRAIDELRKKKVSFEKTMLSWTEVPPGSTPYNPGLEEEIEVSWRQKYVREALETLPHNQREVLALAYFKGYSHSQIAEVLSIPLGTVKSRIQLAMQRLRQVLSRTMMVEF